MSQASSHQTALGSATTSASVVLHPEFKVKFSFIKPGQRGRASNLDMTWSKLCEKLSRVHESRIDHQNTIEEFLALPQDEQARLKDVGAFVGGPFRGGIRKGENLIERHLLTLDVDSATAAQFGQFDHDLSCQDGLSDGAIFGWEFVAYSTRRHTAEKPKFRIVLPLSRPVDRDEFAALSRIVASCLFDNVSASMDAVDDVSFTWAQIMYWPAICRGSTFWHRHNKGRPVDPDAVFAAWGDWKDWTLLPHSDKRKAVRPSSGKKAENPKEKKGIVGAFCRAYTVPQAIKKFLPEIYVPGVSAGGKPRYTYKPGTSTNGAIVEDDGLFLFSHHGTDPYGERLVNAFDMVRLHLFGSEDNGVNENEQTPTKMPSYKAFVGFLKDDEKTRQQSVTDKLKADADLLDAFDDDVPDATGVIVEDDGLGDEPVVEEWTGLNKTCALVEIPGKQTVIARFSGDGQFKYFIGVQGLHQYYEKDQRLHADLQGKMRQESISQIWMKSPDRRTYKGVTFDPTCKAPKSVLNLWPGVTLKPDERGADGCALFLEHVREILCSGHQASYEYLINWLAHMIQYPGKKPGVAVVVNGREGAGKDMVAAYISRMLPSSLSQMVNKAEHLLGKFNSHLINKLFVHVEEAFFSGNRKDVDDLKGLVTGDKVNMERKGIDVIEMPAFERVYMSSNSDSPVVISPKDRRYFALTASDKKLGNHGYFNDLAAEMAGAGPACLLHHLQSIDLSDFEVKNYPTTAAILNIRRNSASGLHRWWGEVLYSGVLPGTGDDGYANNGAPRWQADDIPVCRDRLRKDYERFMRETAYQGAPVGPEAFGRTLKELCGASSTRPRANDGSRARQYKIPPLPVCLQRYEAIYGKPDDE